MSTEAPATVGYDVFAGKVQTVLGFDLDLYRPEQMHRRLENFLGRFPGETFGSLARRLEQDAGFAASVRDYLTINVSEFFRNPEQFERLRADILPRLGRRPLRIWSAGCSIGAEAYSLAILVREAGLAGASIWATDIDPGVLSRARAGVYDPSELKSVDPTRLARSFVRMDGGRYALRPEVRQGVRVQRHDLLHDSFPTGWDLIVCRNVVIYFTGRARAELYERFGKALRPGGFLFTGGTESVQGAVALGLRMVAPCFYQKVDEGENRCAGSQPNK